MRKTLSNDFFPRMKQGSAWIGIFLILIFLTTMGLALSANIVQTMKAVKKQEQLSVVQALAEAGIEKTIWKLNRGDAYFGETELTLPTGQVDIEVFDEGSDTKIITATGYVPNKQMAQRKRTIRVKLKADFNQTGMGFRYGVQAGSLGVIMENNTTIAGNVYSSGSVIGGNNNSQILGDVFVSGQGNGIENIIIGKSSAPANGWAYYIKDSYIWGNAKAINGANISSTTVKGTTSYGPQPPGENLPITDATLSTWEGWAAAGNNGVPLGNTTINGIQSLGPIKIDGNLVVNGQLRMTGIIWVTGDVIFNTGSYVYLDPSFGTNSSMIIADRPTDRNNYGKITVNPGTKICGSYALSYWSDCYNGTIPNDPTYNGSYIMLLSTKNAPAIGNPAIYAGNNSKAVVYYTTQGILELRNNGAARAVTGGGLHINNNAIIEYDRGLINANFSAGPGGSWIVAEWQVIYS